MATPLRAVIMLVILIGAPIAWIYLGPLPVEAQQVVGRLIATVKIRLGLASVEVSGQPKKAAPRFDSRIREQNNCVVARTNTAGLMADVKAQLEQLQSMGATEYTLEPWGKGGILYRFCCIMPIGPADDLTTQFEAVDEDPRATVTQVLQEVVSWYANQHGSQPGPIEPRLSFHGASLPR